MIVLKSKGNFTKSISYPVEPRSKPRRLRSVHSLNAYLRTVEENSAQPKRLALK